MKKNIVLLIILFLLIIVVGCENEEKLKIEGADILEIGFDETFKLFNGNREIDPESAYWTSSDRSIALCNNGVIKPLKEGICNITAVLKNDGTKIATTTISITDAIIKSIEIYSRDGYTLFVDDVLILDYKIQPQDVNVKLTWSSDNPQIASVDETGCVTGKSVGKTNIILKSGKAISVVEVAVKEKVTELKMTCSNTAIVGQSFKLSFNIDDVNVSLENNDGILEKIGNYYFAKKTGTVKVKATSKSFSSLKNEFDINVIEGEKNKMHSKNNNEEEISSSFNAFNDMQKFSQKIVMYTALNNVKEDDDGAFINETVSGRMQKVYLIDYYENKIFGNYQFSSINGVDDAKGNLNTYYNYSFATNNFGSFNILDVDILNRQGYFSYKINNNGLAHLQTSQFEAYYNAIGTQLREYGYNVVIENGYNYSKQLNSYSDDIIEENYYSTLARKSYEKLGIMVGYKLEYVEEPNYVTMIKNAINLVNNDVDLIQIDYNYQNFVNSMSLVEYLRNELEYEGLIYLNTDYYDFYYEDNSIESAFNYFKTALLQGVDFINAPVAFSSRGWYRDGFNEIVLPMYDTALSEYSSNVEFKEKVDESAKRIIGKKCEYNVNVEQKISEANIDHSTSNKYVSSILKSLYKVSDDFKPINKDDRLVVFGYQYSKGSYYEGGRTNYNFVKNIQESFGKNYNMIGYNDYYSGFNAYKEDYNSSDQVVFLMNNKSYSYSYTVDGRRVYDNINLIEMVESIRDLGVNNICVILTDDPYLESNLPDYCAIINSYANYTIGYSEIIDILKNGK